MRVSSGSRARLKIHVGEGVQKLRMTCRGRELAILNLVHMTGYTIDHCSLLPPVYILWYMLC